MAHLITTLGPKRVDELAMILPHEHVFVGIRTPDQPGHAQADLAQVMHLMAPEIARAHAVAVTVIVECTPVGVGRRADILAALSAATGVPLVVPTGIYREPWVPSWAQTASEDELCDWMRSELEGTIEQSGVQAGFIKLSAGDDGLTACETKILHAAAQAAAATGAVIGSHTIRGQVVREQIAIIEAAGYSSRRFIWIHASADPDVATNIEIARRGAWIEYDCIGEPSTDAAFIDRIGQMLDAGLERHILLSQDRGWYDPAQADGGTPRPYTYLSEHFLPKLRAAGVDAHTIRQLMVTKGLSKNKRAIDHAILQASFCWRETNGTDRGDQDHAHRDGQGAQGKRPPPLYGSDCQRTRPGWATACGARTRLGPHDHSQRHARTR